MVGVVLDPGRDPSPGGSPGREGLDAPQLEFHGGVPRFDHRVVAAPSPGRRMDWGMTAAAHAGPEGARYEMAGHGRCA